MSSVPVQFLIYVMPQPTCSNAPVIIPHTDCMEVTVGISKTFNVTVLNLCNPSTIKIDAILTPLAITGMKMSNLTQMPTNASLYYVTFTWIPQTSQIGLQEMCMIAYTR